MTGRCYFNTPRTRLRWSTLSEWLKAAVQLEKRRASYLNNQRKAFHVEALPLHLIAACSEQSTLLQCLDLLKSGSSGFRQPMRGQRGNAPHTALLVAINNRLSQLNALAGECAAERPFSGCSAMQSRINSNQEGDFK